MATLIIGLTMVIAGLALAGYTIHLTIQQKRHDLERTHH